MKRLIIFILTAVLFTTVSCTKFGKNITVKGKVLNPITHEPISGITVFMHQSWKSKTIKKMVTGEDGEFELSVTHLGHVWAGTDYANYQDYYDLGWDYQNKYYSEIKVDKGKIMHVDYHLVPYGNYQLKINNVNCGGADTLILNQTNQVGSFLGIDWVTAGCNGYVSALEKVPMGTIHTKCTVIRNGISNTYTIDFEVKPNQDNIQEINY